MDDMPAIAGNGIGFARLGPSGLLRPPPHRHWRRRQDGIAFPATQGNLRSRIFCGVTVMKEPINWWVEISVSTAFEISSISLQ